MKEQPISRQDQTTPSDPVRIHYLPVARAVPEMILGMPLVITEHGVVRYHLPAGHVLNMANLDQLKAHHAEIICVQEPDIRTPDEREAGFAAAENKLDQVFKLADHNNPLVKNLRQAVLAYLSR